MNLFVYGSLIFPEVWQPLVTQHYTSSIGFLARYQRTKILMDTYPLAYPDAHASGFLGQVYYQVSPLDLARLDRFEGAIYLRQECEVLTPEGMVQAQIYRPKPQFTRLISTTPWTPALFEACLKPIFLSRYCQHH